jgi:UDP:flavonoid glycosyltransferase YjiC (YdhE family)
MPEATATPRTRTAPRLLFVPVSGPHGSGELMRCLILARELRRADPAVEVHFLVSRNAVFREGVEFPVHDCDDSPTRSTTQVLATIAQLRPHVVLFDNAGRTEQLRAAKAAGAKLVFSSRSPRLRWKAFRVTWLRLLDEHWIVFPKFVTGGLSAYERLKLRCAPGYRVRHLDTFFTPSLPAERATWLAGQGLSERGYTVFVPGGRGEGAAGDVDPAELFEAAARQFVQDTGQTAVVLTGRAQPVAAPGSGLLRLLPRVRPEEVQHLLAGAALVVSNGGTTLVHALAHGQAIVSVPLATDQARRIRRAARRGVVVPARPDAADIARTAVGLSRDDSRAASLRAEVARLGLVNGVDEAVAALRDLAYA